MTSATRPGHEAVAIPLLESLRAYLRAEPVGMPAPRCASSAGTSGHVRVPRALGDAREEVCPLDWLTLRSVLLAADVLSPSSLRADCFTKRRLYQEPGDWVIDPEERMAEVWRPDELPRIERWALTWAPDEARAPLRLEPAELFRAI